MNSQVVKLTEVPLREDRPELCALLTLNRPQAANAFNELMMTQLLEHIGVLEDSSKPFRCVILQGKGKHFSAGADLGWMQKAAQLTPEQNLEQVRRLSELYHRLYSLPLPTLAVVNGAAFGGAVGLVACCDWAIATEHAKFCLSEVKVGLVAAVILPYVSQKMSVGALNRWVLSGKVFGSEEALTAGLVQRVVSSDELPAIVREEVNSVLTGAPEAQRTYKERHHAVLETRWRDWADLREAMVRTLADLRITPSAQEGLHSFFESRWPAWAFETDPQWKPFVE